MEAPAKRMLIVENDPEVGTELEDFFRLLGYTVTRTGDGDQALQLIKAQTPYDIVLIKRGLPGHDGLDVLREARRNGFEAPVVMLAAEEARNTQATDVMPDEYVTGPFDAEELAARVRALLQRFSSSEAAPLHTVRIGNVEIDFKNRTAHRNGEVLHFTALELDILHYLIRHRGRTVNRKQLLRDVWRISPEINTRTIDRHIASIRKKIEPHPGEPIYIETVYGVGYRFSG
ncbi:MAG: DNA-binding response regulator [Rhodothermaceae bacterium]|nr:MAG: DNA-binding response regulator [Rhodothermaceae bacterium]